MFKLEEIMQSKKFGAHLSNEDHEHLLDYIHMRKIQNSKTNFEVLNFFAQVYTNT